MNLETGSVDLCLRLLGDNGSFNFRSGWCDSVGA